MSAHSRTLLSYLHRLAAPAVPDSILLAQWIEQRNQDAFAALMARHGPMVLGVCRRILGDAQDAEEAFQATFLVFSRKAATLRRSEALASFLYGIALRLARKARAAKKRRPLLQSSADAPEPVDPQPHALDVLSGRELLALLDAEIARLPEVYRLPLLLCVLQGRTVEEAARQLGWTIGSVRGRLARGRERLRQRLTRRGLDLSVGALALLAPVAVPERLLALSLHQLSSPSAAAVTVLVAGWSSVLKLKTVCLSLVLLAAVGVGAGLSFLATPVAEIPSASPANKPPADAKHEPRRDRHGDPLPPGAVARLGTRRFRVDAYEVDHLAFAPDGKTIAVVSSKAEGPNALCLIDATTGKQKKFIPPPKRGVWFDVNAFSAGDKRLMALAMIQMPGSRKKLLQVWDAESGQKVSEFNMESTKRIWSGCTAEGRLRIACLSKGEISFHETATGGKRRFSAKDFPDPTSGFPCWCIAGKSLLVAANDKGVVHLWDITSGEERHTLQTKGVLVGNPVLSPDERWLATLSRDAADKVTVQLWETRTGKVGHTLAADQQLPESAVFSLDGKYVATFGRRTIRVWDAATGQPLTQIRRSRPHWAAGCAVSADGRSLFSCWDDKLLVCDTATGRELHALKPDDLDQPNTRPKGGVVMYLSHDHRKAIVFTMDMEMTGWDTLTRKQLFHRRITSLADSNWVAVSANADILALPHAERGDTPQARKVGLGPMYLEKLQSGERLLTFPALKGQTWPLAFSPDGRLLISYTDRTLRFWEVLTARELLALSTGDGNSKVDFSPDGRLLAATAPSGEIFLWDLRRGKELRRFKGLEAQVTSLAFSPDGRRLVSGLSDSTLLVWDVGAFPAKPSDKRGAESLAKAWADLAGADAPRAFQARGTLASAPTDAIPWLRKHLRPASSADGQRLCRLLIDLDSEQFAVRQKAQEELEKLGDLAEPALRKALEDKPTLEARKRVQALLERLRGPVTRPEVLQALRAVAVLEDIGTPEARRLLDELAQGAPEARLTREAKASLVRLQRRTVGK